MEHYNITGMSCAACSARVEKAVSGVSGVDSCSVNLLTNSMTVDGTASPDDIITAVQSAGYGAYKKGASKEQKSNTLKDTETPLLKKRLISSIIFLVFLMYVSMGHTMWGWPLPKALAQNHIAQGIVQLLLCTIIMVINQKFFISGFKSLWAKAPNMDTLVALGSGASFVYSTYALLAMTFNPADSHHYVHEFYFESAAMILTLITVGKMLEARSKGKTTDAIKSLMELAPKTATVIRDGKKIIIPAENILKGDIFIVRPGESIPADGIVIEGTSAVNESSLTGESIPVDKETGSSVSAATVNQSGFIKCEATRIGEDTTLSQIIKMVSDASSTKAPIAKIADRVSGIFVPTVITIAVATLIIWLILGKDAGYALARSISVLVISCPCALGLATPVAIMVGNGVGAKNGILFKTAVSLEETGKATTAVLDKTGTITKGEPKVTDILPSDGITEDELLETAYSLEKKSEHPLANAIVQMAEEKNTKHFDVNNFQAIAGNGLTASFDGKVLSGGNAKFIESKTLLPESAKTLTEKLTEEGKTPLFFCKDCVFMGIIAVADTLKDESPAAIRELQNMGIKVVMLTGDNHKTARAIGKLAGVDEIIADVLPDGKETTIRNLQKQGKVLMVGDGINDAPALTRADTGMAIGAGTDVAIDAADVVLVKSKLTDVPAAIRLSRATLKNIRENLFWAFIYNIIGIPLAAGVFIPFGLTLNPMFGAAAMSLSSFCVVTNALRLNMTDIKSDKKDKKIKKGENKMEKTFKVEGMMCPHCEARVKNTLEAMAEVSKADVSYQSGTATVFLSKNVSDDVLKKVIEDQGYKVID